jgi:hypothetical protein
MCAFAVCVAEAAPKVLRLTPPSYLFSGAERAGAEGGFPEFEEGCAGVDR